MSLMRGAVRVLRSVINKFSVLSREGEIGPPRRLGPGESSVNGVGLHEVLIESPRHDASMARFAVSHLQRILEAYRNRFSEFYGDPRVRHVIIFKNHGIDAGASQQHPHSQIVGLPIVPGQIAERTERARRCFEKTGHCLACMEISQERAHRRRIIMESGDFVTFIRMPRFRHTTCGSFRRCTRLASRNNLSILWPNLRQA
jgi:UDPglucose--hexose-1-phosphate uridylyltransferase